MLINRLWAIIINNKNVLLLITNNKGGNANDSSKRLTDFNRNSDLKGEISVHLLMPKDYHEKLCRKVDLKK